MLRKIIRVVVFVFSVVAASLPAVSPVLAQSPGDPYTIMRPEPSASKSGKIPQPVEPWLAPKYRSPRETRQHVTPPPEAGTPPQRRAQTPPPIVVPQTGRVLPNLRVLPGAGPGGAETGQDRAVRCAHQAGVYGDTAGDRNTYINTCINQ